MFIGKESEERTRVPETQSTLKQIQSRLVNTLPKIKKGKYTAVTEAHKECT